MQQAEDVMFDGRAHQEKELPRPESASCSWTNFQKNYPIKLKQGKYNYPLHQEEATLF